MNCRFITLTGRLRWKVIAGNKIQIIAEKKIKGNDRQVQRGKNALQFKVKQFGNEVIVYIDAPFICFKHRHGHFSYNINRNDWNRSDDSDYKFTFDITIKMPRSAAVHASTINKGMVSVKNTTGRVFASNINGKIDLNHISGQTDANTINGNITAVYDRNPVKNSEFHTINGDIKAYYPKNLSADICFKSLHGDLYTNFDDIKYLKGKVHKNSRNGKSFYRMGRKTKIRIGKGGPTYSFKVLNGNASIKKNKS